MPSKSIWPPTWQQMPRSAGTSMICCSAGEVELSSPSSLNRDSRSAPLNRAPVGLGAGHRRVALVDAGRRRVVDRGVQRRRVVEVDPVVAGRSSGRWRCPAGPPRRAGRPGCRRRGCSARCAGRGCRTSPVRAVCSTRRSGRTARLIGSPGKSLSVTFWKLLSGGAAGAGGGCRRWYDQTGRHQQQGGRECGPVHQVSPPGWFQYRSEAR